MFLVIVCPSVKQSGYYAAGRYVSVEGTDAAVAGVVYTAAGVYRSDYFGGDCSPVAAEANKFEYPVLTAYSGVSAPKKVFQDYASAEN